MSLMTAGFMLSGDPLAGQTRHRSDQLITFSPRTDILAVMDRGAIESDVRARAQAGDHTGAIAALVKGYGPEIYGYLAGVLRSPRITDDDLGDVFAMFCEDVCRGLPAFRFESSDRKSTRL